MQGNGRQCKTDVKNHIKCGIKVEDVSAFIDNQNAERKLSEHRTNKWTINFKPPSPRY